MKFEYFLIGISIFYIANILFNIMFPVLFGVVSIYYLGDYSTIFFLALTAYAITRKKLMDVKLLLIQVLTACISIILLFDLFFLSVSVTVRFLKIVTIIIFLYFSKELVFSVKKEKIAKEKLERANNDLQERNTYLKILLDVSDRAGRELDSQKISQDIVNGISKILEPLGYKAGLIVLYNRDKNCIFTRAVTSSALLSKSGISVENLEEKLSGKNDLLAKTIKNKKIYVSKTPEHFLKGFNFAKGKNCKWQKLFKAKSYVSVPLIANGQVIGAIIFWGNKNVEDIIARNKEVLRAFSAHIGSAIENAMLYEKTESQMKELSRLNKNLKRTNAKLKEFLELKDEFLHITSHQLRTPLTAIRGMISMWIEGDFDKLSKKQKDEMLQRIYNSTERLNSLINDILDALELEGGMLQFKFQ